MTRDHAIRFAAMHCESSCAMEDPYELQRFLDAQDEAGTYEKAVAELRAGRKLGHWMWFVFPQIAGLGRSPLSNRYAIFSLTEARAYLAHPILGRRLSECVHILLNLRGRSAEDIFGGVDAMKLRSSMTLFANAVPANPLFRTVIEEYFAGEPDDGTERMLRIGS